MARTAEDMHAEILKLRGMVAQHQANLVKTQARYAEALKNQRGLVKEAQATMATIQEMEAQIAGLVEAHGEPTMFDFTMMPEEGV